MTVLQRFVYRLKLAPQFTDVPDARMAEIVRGDDAPAVKVALDIGCGTGRNARYLARHGWRAVGVEMIGREVELGRRLAAQQGLAVRLIQGDVTKLDELDVGRGYTLLVDSGCYHTIPVGCRDAYARSVTEVAADDALLIIAGFTRGHGGKSISSADLRARFSGWDLIDAAPVSGEEMAGYVARPALVRAAVRRGVGKPWRFQLRRAAEALPS
jgi:SAM-dependent methyltransferase